MSVKAILVVCVEAFLIQIALSQQCTNRAAIDAYRFSPYGLASSSVYDIVASTGINDFAGRNLPCDRYSPDFTITSGGRLPVTSISSISPTGITVNSDNSFEGPITIIGEFTNDSYRTTQERQLPFLSAVAVEGTSPTNGAGGIQYGCGNGFVGILSEGPSSGLMGPGSYTSGPSIAYSFGSGFGFGPSLGLGNGFGPAAGFGATGFANANRLGCGCRRGILF